MPDLCKVCGTPRRSKESVELELVDAGRTFLHASPEGTLGERCDWLATYVVRLGAELYGQCVWCANQYAEGTRARPELSHG